MKMHSLIVVFLLIGFTGCNSGVKERPTSSPQLVRDIDKIKLTDLDGQPVSLKLYAGKTIFINFWATWCKPCVQEMPSINEAQISLKNKDIVFLLASDETPEQIKEFSLSHDYKLNYVRIENSEEMNVQTLPTTFIFNGAGDKVFMESGARNWNEKNIIDTLLKIVNKK